ncbi:MAG: thioesterase domain-containing protein, partial [Candidatus Binatia bacterium]
TEATVVSTAYDLTDRPTDGARTVPIGRPIANARAYVLDARLEPVPTGVAGELHLAGAGLARGYRHRADLTDERFVRDPFSTDPRARLYRTGDRARWRRDGNLEFLGRNDAQVKLRGFRIELGEIECALRRHASVDDAVVTCVADGAGEKRLVAYVVVRTQLDVDALRRFLRTALPAYMVPAAFIPLPSLPTNANGKIDLRALPKPEIGRHSATRHDAVAAADALEYQLTRIWESVLDVRPIGTRDDFFDLGGHSLLALHLFAQIEKRTGVRLPLASLFGAPTVEQQAALIRSGPAPTRGSAVVAVQPRGTKAPFFCVHAHEGNVLFYRDLARRLGPDQPFLALQSPGLDGTEAPLDRVEDIAARYVCDIRAFQPEGPYFLGGYCFGGPVAFEIARQLEAQGERVALLALFDAYAPGYRERKQRWIVRESIRWKERAVLHASNVVLLPRGRKLAYAVGRLRKILDRTYVRIGLPSSRFHRAVRDSLARAADRYRPQPYSGDVILFRASRLRSGYVPEQSLGWDRLVTGRLDVHIVPGFYGTIVLEPRVGDLVGPLEH